MASIVPPPPTSGATSGVAGVAQAQLQALGEVVVEQVPDRMAQLARTIVITGTIVARQEGGALVLRTQVGELVIRSQTPLPQDRVLTLQIPPGAPPVRALVSAVLPTLPGVAMPVVPAAPGASPAPVSPVIPAPGGTPTAPVPAPTVPNPALPPVTLPNMPLPNVAGSVAGLPATPAGPLPISAPASVQVQPTGAALVPGVPVIQVPRPATVAPAINTSLLAPTAIASPALVQAVAEVPLQAGSVLPAQVLAVPQFTPPSENAPLPRLTLPPAVEAQAQVQQSGSAALRALVQQGLSDILARLPPNVLLPAVSGEQTAMPVGSASGPAAPVPQAVPISASVPSQPAFASLPVLLTLPPGSNVTVQVVSITPPVTQPPATQATLAQPAVTQPSAPVTPPLTAPLPPVATTAAPPVAPTPSLSASPLPVVPPAPLQTATPSAPVFTAVVVGQTAQREPVATSAAGLFVLDNRAPLPVGTQVELSLVNVTEPLPEPVAEVMQRQPQDWPALQQALAGAANMSASLLPSTRLVRPDMAGTTLLFILAALRIGAVQAIGGDELTESLRQRGQVDLIARMSAEFQQMGQSWNRPDSAAGEWKTLALPLAPQGQLTRLAIHTRQEREAHGGENPVPYRRLVVELELSRLGPMLLDGYIRARSMEMTLRSQRLLKKELKDELRLAYRNSLSALGWKGALEFQTAAELWMKA